jgi:arylsulfatase A-like enzyme
LTGKYPSRVDATNFFSGRRGGKFACAPLNDKMPLEETTLAEALKPHGYATFFAGKWHLGPDEQFWPTKQGFDVNKGGFSKGGPYGGKKYFSPYGNPRLDDGPDGEHLPDRLASETAMFIHEHKDEPFFAYLAFYSVHTPLIGRPDLVAKYQEKAKALGLNDKEAFADEEQVWPNAKTPRRVRTLQTHAVYAAMVEAMDEAVGKVLTAIEDAGVAENTIVCLTSDNGGLSTSEGSPTSNLPLRGGKGWVYEGGIREAFMIRAPMVSNQPKQIATPVMSIDFFPTIMNFVQDANDKKVTLPEPIDGQSLKPLLSGGRIERKSLYWHYPHYSNQGGFPGGAIRQGKWKLVERYEDGRCHLYDLLSDPGEQQDLADGNTDLVATMRSDLHAWYKTVDAKFLQPGKSGEVPWSPK